MYDGEISWCYERCGDGLNVNGTHACDDGNTKSGDGCSSTCQIEKGYQCIGYGPGSCKEICDGDWKFWLPCDVDNACCTSDCSTIANGCSCDRPNGCREECGYGLKLGVAQK